MTDRDVRGAGAGVLCGDGGVAVDTDLTPVNGKMRLCMLPLKPLISQGGGVPKKFRRELCRGVKRVLK